MASVKPFVLGACLVLLPTCSQAVSAQATTGPIVAVHSSADQLQDKPAEWYSTDEAAKRIDFVLSKQLPGGGWEKDYQKAPGAAPPPPPFNTPATWEGLATIDNGYTYSEVRFLAKAFALTKRHDARDACLRGIDCLLAMQYPNGGWPQRFPLPDDYGRYITYNDTAMVNVMLLVRDIAAGTGDLQFVDAPRRDRARQAWERGLDCIVKTQIVVNGQPTGWCQQYEPDTLRPAKARSYELPSIAGDETCSILRLLMGIENPTAQTRRAVHAGAAWLDRSKVTGIRLDRKPDPSLPKGFDVTAVEDPTAEPLWARFYEIETNRPFYCGRDGVKKYSMNEIEAERRAGYAWLRPWGKAILQQYAKWSQKHPASEAH